MTLDIVDHENKKVGSVDVSDEVFGGRVNADVMWESVVHANAAARRGTHQTKNRADVVVVEALTAAEVKTKAAAELLKTLTVTGKAVLIDVALDENMSRSVRNIAGVTFVSSQRVTARDIIDARRVV